MTAARGPVADEQLRIVPANEASWEDLRMIFGTADYPRVLLCQRFKVTGGLSRDTTLDERTSMLQAGTACDPGAEQTTACGR